MKTKTTIALSTIIWENTYHNHGGRHTTQPTNHTIDETLQPLRNDELDLPDLWRERFGNACGAGSHSQRWGGGGCRPAYLRPPRATESLRGLVNHRLLPPTPQFLIQQA